MAEVVNILNEINKSIKELSNTPSAAPMSFQGMTPEEIKKQFDEIHDNLDKQYQKQLEIEEAKKKELETTTLSSRRMEEIVLQSDLRMNSLNRQISVMREMYVELEKQDDLSEEDKARLENMLELIDKKRELVDEISDRYARQRRDITAINRTQENVKNVLKTITGMNFDYESSVFAEMIRGFRASSIDEFTRSATNAFKEHFSLGNVLGHVWSSTKRLVGQMDDARASFQKTNGTTGEYTNTIMTLRREYAEFGVNMKDSFQAFDSLMKKFAGFRDLSMESQKEIAGHTLVMERLGVSHATTAKYLQLTTKSLGMTRAGALQTQKQFVKLASSVNMSADELVAAYSDSLDSLASYGEGSKEIFANLAKFADKAGMSVKTLLNITKQFDTFEGAATQVGKLNAMLGGSYLSTTDMLMAKEDEKILKIKQAMDAAGLQFDQMGRHQKLYITNALGLQSVAEAAALMRGSVSSLNARLKEQTLTQQEAEKRAKLYTTIQEKMNVMFENFAIALGPIVSILGDLLDILGTFLLPVLSVLDFTIGNIVRGLAWLLNKLKETNEGMAAISVVVGLLTARIIYLKAASMGATSAMGFLKMAAGGVFNMFKKVVMFIPGLVTGLLGIGSTAPAAGAAMGASAGPTSAFGLSLLFVGAAIALIVSSIALLVFAFADVIAEAGKANTSIMEVAAGFAILSLAAAGVAIYGVAALVGLGAIAVGIGAVGLAMLLVNMDKLNAMANVFGKLDTLMSGFETSKFQSIVNGIKQIADAIDDIDDDKTIAVSQLVETISRTTEGAAQVAKAQATGKAVKGLTVAARGGTGASMARGGAQTAAAPGYMVNQTIPPIIIKIEEREIVRIFEKYVQGKANVGLA